MSGYPESQGYCAKMVPLQGPRTIRAIRESVCREPEMNLDIWPFLNQGVLQLNPLSSLFGAHGPVAERSAWSLPASAHETHQTINSGEERRGVSLPSEKPLGEERRCGEGSGSGRDVEIDDHRDPD